MYGFMTSQCDMKFEEKDIKFYLPKSRYEQWSFSWFGLSDMFYRIDEHRASTSQDLYMLRTDLLQIEKRIDDKIKQLMDTIESIASPTYSMTVRFDDLD